MLRLTFPSGPPQPLPSLARHRFARIGHGSEVGRADLHRLCGSSRAGDQFVHVWQRKGLLVPLAWGRYLVPTEKAWDALLSVRSATHSRFLSWALAKDEVFGRGERVGFIGPVLWALTDLSITDPAPIVGLVPDERCAPRPAPQFGAFAADLTAPLRPTEIRVGHSSFRVPSPDPADVAWILSMNMDARLSWAGATLLRALPPARRHLVRTALRTGVLLAAPAPGRPAASLPVGPPHNHRLIAPPWFHRVHEHAVAVAVRRSALA